QGSTEDQAGQGQGDSDHTILAKCALVPLSSPHVSEQASTDPQEVSRFRTGQAEDLLL
ncbi:hypothetical protein BGZ93_004706, partial [Podila epicladia]